MSAENLLIPKTCRDCPPLPVELKRTHYSFQIDQNIPFAAVTQEITKCLAKISDYKFVHTSSEKSWLGKMEVPGVKISHIKLNLYCSHEPIVRTAPTRYIIEARRILGDIPAFYSFVRELHVKLNNKPAENDFLQEETEDLNEEFIVQCAEGAASVVRRMLSLPQVDPLRFNKSGTTALHTICQHGHQHLFTLLMEVKDDKMDLYLRASNTGRTPMETALDNQQMDFIEFMHQTHNIPLPFQVYSSVVVVKTSKATIAAGATPEESEGTMPVNVHPELHIQLYHAAIENSVERMKIILNSVFKASSCQQMDLLNGTLLSSEVGETPLYGAASRGFTDVVRFLLEKGANGAIPAQNSWSPLYAASANGYTEIVCLLVRAANVQVNFQNNDGMTPLFIAACHSFVEVCRILLKNGADPNVGDEHGARPLHTAVRNHCVPIVELLLDRHADVNVVKKNSGSSPWFEPAFVSRTDFEWQPLGTEAMNGGVALASKVADIENSGVSAFYVACQKGNCKIAWLLKARGADIHQRGTSENTPLHVASLYGHMEMVAQLIEWGAKISARNADQATPFHMAAENRHLDVLSLLHSTGKVDVNAVNSRGVTPLNIASFNGHLDVVERLLELNADVNCQSGGGASALFIASQKGHIEIVCALLAHHANVNVTTNNGETALFQSAYFGHLAITRQLMAAGANINTTDNKGRTPLWWAAKNNKAESVHLLLSVGADITLRDNEGKTPALIAAELKHRNISWLLPPPCSICNENISNVLYMPCKDMLYCSECNPDDNSLVMCPVCGEEIFETIVVETTENNLSGELDSSEYSAQAVQQLNFEFSVRICSCNTLVRRFLLAPPTEQAAPPPLPPQAAVQVPSLPSAVPPLPLPAPVPAILGNQELHQQLQLLLHAVQQIQQPLMVVMEHLPPLLPLLAVLNQLLAPENNVVNNVVLAPIAVPAVAVVPVAPVVNNEEVQPEVIVEVAVVPVPAVVAVINHNEAAQHNPPPNDGMQGFLHPRSDY